MSSLDWLQVVAGFRYCLRRAITAVAAMLACPQKREAMEKQSPV